MDQTYETRRRSGKHGSSDAKGSKLRPAPETKSRTEKNMSKKAAAKSQKPQEQKPQVTSVARVSEYEGHPVIALHKYPEDKHPLMFGTVKAGLILAHYPDIKAFFAMTGEKQEATAAA